ncbi:MAG: beta-galactosidase, partial [bacterium]|nr:beta-galactosidase [bacterium]
MPNIGYDHRAVTIDGKRTLLLSGAIHYPRSTPGMWRSLMQHSKEAGLNAIETYVFWNLHERRRGVYDFSDRLDLRRFLDTTQEFGLYVILRIGPYICAETNYGGLPAWLRDVPGIQMRTDNEPFLREMGRWVRFLCDYLRPYFAPNGGPIILAQIENEYGNIAWRYGEEGERYLKRLAEMAEALQVGVPWVMCKGSAPGIIETINAFYAHPLLDEYFTQYPDKPALWTEHWPGWYDLWGYPHNRRTPENVAYAAARFFAAGGTGMNYYMWHGGTNFDRDGSFLQTTSYDYDAPLDEYGLPTTKMYHLARLHRILQDYADVLVESERARPETLEEGVLVYAYQHAGRSLVFLCHDDPQHEVTVSYEGRRHTLPPQSVTLIGDGQPLMNTAQVEPQCVVERRMKPCDTQLSPFQWWVEP